jgi:hypothetical protein
LCERGARNLDPVVKGQAADDLNRRVLDRCENSAQSDQRLELDALDQMHENVVEDLNLFFGERGGIVDEKLGDTMQYFAASGRIVTPDGGVQFVNEWRCTAHY